MSATESRKKICGMRMREGSHLVLLTVQKPQHVLAGYTHGGTRKLVAVIECCGARLETLVPLVVFKGTSYYRGWHTEATKDTSGRLF